MEDLLALGGPFRKDTGWDTKRHLQFNDLFEVVFSFPVEDKGEITWKNENNRLKQTEDSLKGLDTEKKERLFQEAWGHILWDGAKPAKKKKKYAESSAHNSEIETAGSMWDGNKKFKYPMKK